MIRALFIWLFCSYEDFQQAGKNGAVRQMLAKDSKPLVILTAHQSRDRIQP